MKGELFVVGHTHEQTKIPPEQRRIEKNGGYKQKDGYLLCRSPLITHDEQSFTLSFHTRNDCATYNLWYKVGGGGGHQLFVDRLKVYQTVYDDSSKSRKLVYRLLEERGRVVSSVINSASNASRETNVLFVGLLRSVVESLLESFVSANDDNGIQPTMNPTLVAWLDSHKIPANRDTLVALSELTSLLQNYLSLQAEQPHHYGDHYAYNASFPDEDRSFQEPSDEDDSHARDEEVQELVFMDFLPGH